MVKNRPLKIHTKEQLRWDLYPIFLKLMKNGFEIEALLFILSTWNFARFRYVMRTFDLDNFKSIMKKVKPRFNNIKRENFQKINFEKYANDIKYIFNILAHIKGIEKTGAPKLMHLEVPNVFVMWDSYIRAHYGFSEGNAQEYLEFLKKMQKKFSKVKVKSNRTLPKLIDEHNYNMITEPILEKQRKNQGRL